MSESRDFDRMARAWLDLMPDTAPDRAVAAVLEAVETMPQLRSSPLGGSRRSSTVTRLALVAATLLIAAMGAYALVAGGPQQPVTLPSIAPTTSAAAVDGPLDDVLRAKWLSIANENPVLENGSGPVTLSIGPSGADIIAANFGPGLDYPSTTTQLGLDELEVVLTRDSRDCGAGDRGVYRWALSADRSRLTLTAKSDNCTMRAVVFGRVWVRSLVGPTTAGAGVIDVLDPDFAITLPDDTYGTRTLDDFVEIASSNGVALLVFKNPQPFADACSTAEERIPYLPGADAFIEAFRANDAFEVGEAEELTIDGHRAVHVQIGGKPNFARCPGQDLYLYTPRLCQCHFVVGQGAADSDYLVEVGEDTFLFVVSPIDSPNEREIIESLRIPFDLPVQ